MPIYEYRCAGCGADFDQLVRADDTPACPWCESEDLERKLSVSSLGSRREAASTSLPLAKGAGGCCGGGCGCH
ncbi:MAG TPA: zinc ribbon domain-containing protein [Gemmatimonadota bacterium]|jgi:putative FmdB family regulatory protein